MSKKTESNSYTMLFAVLMVVVVGSILAYVAYSLKDKIAENRKTEKKQNILYAFGVTGATVTGDASDAASFVPTTEATALFDQYVTKQYILENGTVSENQEAYLIDLKKEKDAAKADASYAPKRPFFKAELKGDTFFIVPMYGNGLWDAIWGYVALDKDLVVKGVFFDHKGETPGLGAEIKQKYFQDRFLGERIFSKDGSFAGVTVKKGNGDPKSTDKLDNEVDAITGATITGDGVTRMFTADIAPYISTLKQMVK